MQVVDLALALRRRGHDVALVAAMSFLDFEDSLQAAGVSTFRLGVRSKREILTALRRYISVVRQWRPDVVHAHLVNAILLTRIARPFANVPLLIGSSHTPLEPRKVNYLLYRLTHSLGDKWTSVSRAGIRAHERASAVPLGQGILVRNGVVLTRFRASPARRVRVRQELGLQGGDFLWLTIGSFRDEAKDYDNLLGAFARVAKSSPHAHLAIAGEGRLLESKRVLAKTLGIADKVSFLGLRRDVEALMSAADAFVLASMREGMPLVLIEAGAMGLPIVATDVGESSAIVQHGVSGFVVAPRSELELAGSMRQLMELPPDERLKMGEAGRAHVNATFDMEVVVDEWLHIYEQNLANRGARRTFSRSDARACGNRT